jgi:hypothetical protein
LQHLKEVIVLRNELIDAAFQELIEQLGQDIVDPPFQPIGSADLYAQATWKAITGLGFDRLKDKDLFLNVREQLFLMAKKLGYSALVLEKEAQINERYRSLPLIPRRPIDPEG